MDEEIVETPDSLDMDNPAALLNSQVNRLREKHGKKEEIVRKNGTCMLSDWLGNTRSVDVVLRISPNSETAIIIPERLPISGISMEAHYMLTRDEISPGVKEFAIHVQISDGGQDVPVDLESSYDNLKHVNTFLEAASTFRPKA